MVLLVVVGQTHKIRVFCRIRSGHWKIHPKIKIMVGVITISMRLHKAIDPRGGPRGIFTCTTASRIGKGIVLWLTLLMQRLAMKGHFREVHTQTKLGYGTDGNDGASQSDSTTTCSLITSRKGSGLNSLDPLP